MTRDRLRTKKRPDGASGATPKRKRRPLRTVLIVAGSAIAGFYVVQTGVFAYFGADIPAIYASRVQAIEKKYADKYPQGEIVLTGSSFFERWTTSQSDLAPLQTTNIGIGGTKIGDQAEYLDRLVLPFDPRALVVYAGSNDINGFPFFSKSGADTAARVEKYLETMHAKLPEAELFYVAITEAPSRAGVRAEIQQANALIAEWSKAEGYVTFIDTAPTLLTSDGEIDPTLFGSDNLHFNEAGYVKFNEAIRPVLIDALGE